MKWLYCIFTLKALIEYISNKRGHGAPGSRRGLLPVMRGGVRVCISACDRKWACKNRRRDRLIKMAWKPNETWQIPTVTSSHVGATVWHSSRLVARGPLTGGMLSRQTCAFYQKVNYLLSVWQGGCVRVNGCNEADYGRERADFSPVFFSHYLRGKYVNAYEKDVRFISVGAILTSIFLLHLCVFVKYVSSLVKHNLFFVRCPFNIRADTQQVDQRHIVFDRCESDCWEIDSCEIYTTHLFIWPTSQGSLGSVIYAV